MRLHNRDLSLYCALLTLAFAAHAASADWPTYRNDNSRSGVTSVELATPLHLQWVFNPLHRPKTAWPEPAEEMPRAHSDNANHVVVGGGLAYFGSSADNDVYALNIKTGEVQWRFETAGPVRFAPAYDRKRLYFGSDDGYVYCVNAKSGRLVWKHRMGPNDSKVIGNGRMISSWPVRTSVLVDNGTVFSAAGVFPFEGIVIAGLDASDGKLLWEHDTLGDRGHELLFGGISPQGYLLASDTILYVPSGRAAPAAFDRENGKLHFYAETAGKSGGTWALLAGDRLVAGVDGKTTYNPETGEISGDAYAWSGGRDMVVSENTCYSLTKRGIDAIKRSQEIMNKDDDSSSPYSWRFAQKGLSTLVLTWNLVIAGGDGLVVAIDSRDGKEAWRAEVDGIAHGLAISDDRLLVSTHTGAIYCFGKNKVDSPAVVKDVTPVAPPRDVLHTTAVVHILSDTDIRKGFCLVLDCEAGALATELASKTDLYMVCIEDDPEKRAVARRTFRDAGILGTRAIVENWDPSDLPKYFANLVVSDGMMLGGKSTPLSEEVMRLVQPYGGTVLTAVPEGGDKTLTWSKYVRPPLEGAGSWTALYANHRNTACSEDKLVKGPFSITWFGEPGPKHIVDRHARPSSPVSMNGRFFVQGEEMIRGYDAYNGTLLWTTELPGAVRVRVDSDGGNLALTEDALYVAAFDKCYKLDPLSGSVVRTYGMPRSPDRKRKRWGHISTSHGLLFGTTAEPLDAEYASVWDEVVDEQEGRWRPDDEISEEMRDWLSQSVKQEYPVPDEDLWMEFHRAGTLWHRMSSTFPAWGANVYPTGERTENIMSGDSLFALDAKSGDPVWIHRGPNIPNISVTIAGETIFFVEDITDPTQREAALDEVDRLAEAGIYERAEPHYRVRREQADVRNVLAVDLRTGAIRWKRPLAVTGCGGDKMGLAFKDNVLLLFAHHSNHDTGQFLGGMVRWRRVTALDARNGAMMWSRPLNYLRRPLIMGDTVIIEPRACDLHTGRTKMVQHPVTGKPVPWEFLRPGHCCSITSASADTFFYRSGCTAIYEMTADRGLAIFGGIRPGCWINIIPSNGLMLMPEASSGCTCSYPIKGSFAMVNREDRNDGHWTVFIRHGAMTPVQHLAVNFGAPGDMRANDGKLWFGYPRPNAVSDIGYGEYGVRFALNEEFAEGMDFVRSDYRDLRVLGTDQPWLFASSARGILKFELPLIDSARGQGSGAYTVRLGFMAPGADRNGRRVFDVKLQGETVLKEFDIAREAGGVHRALVREFKGIEVVDDLVVELSAKRAKDNRDPDRAPVINFVEVSREDAIVNVEPQSLSDEQAAAILLTARADLEADDRTAALEKAHYVFDAARTVESRVAALDTMAVIASPASIPRLREVWQQTTGHILHEYRSIDERILAGSFRVCIPVAVKLGEENGEAAQELLEHAATAAGQTGNADLQIPLLDAMTNGLARGAFVTGAVHAHRRARRHNEAIKLYRWLVGQMPGDAIILNQFAWYLVTIQPETERRPELARNIATQAVELMPQEAGLIDTLAVATYQCGDIEEAVRLMQKAVALDPHPELVAREQEYRAELEARKAGAK